jgi:glycosyltransferase involved in cell wall biosynthesis
MLESLFLAMEGVTFEVIVIDGDSKDNTLEVLAKHEIENVYSEFECLGPGRHSWGEIYNFGFSKSNAKWLMYCSDDIIFNLGCFSHAVETLNNQPDGIAGGMFYYKNTPPPDSLFGEYGIDYTFGKKLMINYGLIRREDFWNVGGLDTGYMFYCADGDLCFKLYEAGKDFIPLPLCLVEHFKGIDSMTKFHFNHSGRDIARYKEKWIKYVEIYSCLDPRRLWLDSE